MLPGKEIEKISIHLQDPVNATYKNLLKSLVKVAGNSHTDKNRHLLHESGVLLSICHTFSVTSSSKLIIASVQALLPFARDSKYKAFVGIDGKTVAHSVMKLTDFSVRFGFLPADVRKRIMKSTSKRARRDPKPEEIEAVIGIMLLLRLILESRSNAVEAFETGLPRLMLYFMCTPKARDFLPAAVKNAPTLFCQCLSAPRNARCLVSGSDFTPPRTPFHVRHLLPTMMAMTLSLELGLVVHAMVLPLVALTAETTTHESFCHLQGHVVILLRMSCRVDRTGLMKIFEVANKPLRSPRGDKRTRTANTSDGGENTSEDSEESDSDDGVDEANVALPMFSGKQPAAALKYLSKLYPASKPPLATAPKENLPVGTLSALAECVCNLCRSDVGRDALASLGSACNAAWERLLAENTSHKTKVLILEAISALVDGCGMDNGSCDAESSGPEANASTPLEMRLPRLSTYGDCTKTVLRCLETNEALRHQCFGLLQRLYLTSDQMDMLVLVAVDVLRQSDDDVALADSINVLNRWWARQQNFQALKILTSGKKIIASAGRPEKTAVCVVHGVVRLLRQPKQRPKPFVLVALTTFLVEATGAYPLCVNWAVEAGVLKAIPVVLTDFIDFSGNKRSEYLNKATSCDWELIQLTLKVLRIIIPMPSLSFRMFTKETEETAVSDELYQSIQAVFRGLGKALWMWFWILDEAGSTLQPASWSGVASLLQISLAHPTMLWSILPKTRSQSRRIVKKPPSVTPKASLPSSGESERTPTAVNPAVVGKSKSRSRFRATFAFKRRKTKEVPAGGETDSETVAPETNSTENGPMVDAAPNPIDSDTAENNTARSNTADAPEVDVESLFWKSGSVGILLAIVERTTATASFSMALRSLLYLSESPSRRWAVLSASAPYRDSSAAIIETVEIGLRKVLWIAPYHGCLAFSSELDASDSARSLCLVLFRLLLSQGPKGPSFFMEEWSVSWNLEDRVCALVPTLIAVATTWPHSTTLRPDVVTASLASLMYLSPVQSVRHALLRCRAHLSLVKMLLTTAQVAQASSHWDAAKRAAYLTFLTMFEDRSWFTDIVSKGFLYDLAAAISLVPHSSSDLVLLPAFDCVRISVEKASVLHDSARKGALLAACRCFVPWVHHFLRAIPPPDLALQSIPTSEPRLVLKFLCPVRTADLISARENIFVRRHTFAAGLLSATTLRGDRGLPASPTAQQVDFRYDELPLSQVPIDIRRHDEGSDSWASRVFAVLKMCENMQPFLQEASVDTQSPKRTPLKKRLSNNNDGTGNQPDS